MVFRCGRAAETEKRTQVSVWVARPLELGRRLHGDLRAHWWLRLLHLHASLESTGTH